MKFALLLWNEYVDAGSALPPGDVEALSAYLERLRGEGVSATLDWYAMAPTSRWTRGLVKSGGNTRAGIPAPGFDPTAWYGKAELAGVLTIECDDAETALLCASWFPLPMPIEVRPITAGPNADDTQALTSSEAMREVALGYWAGADSLGWQRADDILSHRHDLVPALIRALALTAAPSQLPLIGVGPLESLSIDAATRGLPDPTIDLLIAADLPTDALLKILMGTRPHYLEKWNIAERLKGVLSEEQLAVLVSRHRDDGDDPLAT